jgi:hypothetical protein
MGATSIDVLPSFCGWLRAMAARARGCFEGLPPALRGRVDPWGLMPRLLSKAGGSALDPSGVFSPGRFVGGI